MNDDDLTAAISALDPTRALGDEAIDDLFPEDRLIRAVANARDDVTDITALTPPSRRRHRLATVTVAATVVGLAVALAAVDLGARAGHHAPASAARARTSVGVPAGVNTHLVFGPAGSSSPGRYPTFHALALCRPERLRVSLVQSTARSRPDAGWGGVIWFTNTGAACSLPAARPEVDAVGANHSAAIGPTGYGSYLLTSVSLAPGQSAYATVSLAPAGALSGRLGADEATAACAATRATGIVVRGLLYGWPNEYFALEHSVDVCSRSFVSASASALTPITGRSR